MLHIGIPLNQSLNDDKFHLSPKGTGMDAGNLKRTLHSCLAIKTHKRAPTRVNSFNNSPSHSRGYKNPKGENWDILFVYGDSYWGRKH